MSCTGGGKSRVASVRCIGCTGASSPWLESSRVTSAACARGMATMSKAFAKPRRLAAAILPSFSGALVSPPRTTCS